MYFRIWCVCYARRREKERERQILNIVTYNLREGHYTQLLSIVRPQSVGHSWLFTPSLATRLDIFPGYFPYISPFIPLFTTQNTNSHTMPQQYGCVVMEMNGVELKIMKVYDSFRFNY